MTITGITSPSPDTGPGVSTLISLLGLSPI